MINPKLVIVFPASVASYWSALTTTKELWQGNNLHLRVRDGDYARRTVGEGVNLKSGFKLPYATAAAKSSGFQVKIRDTREDLWLAMKELAEYCAGDGYQIIPITIYDYCLRETRADREAGYRTRTGYIPADGVEDIGGSATVGYVQCETGVEVITQPVVRLGAGFSFKFMEIESFGYY